MKKIMSKVKGISQHQDVLNTVSEGDKLVLEKEPDNEFDKNAIKIMTETKQTLGYISRNLANELKNQLENITCHALTKTGQD